MTEKAELQKKIEEERYKIENLIAKNNFTKKKFEQKKEELKAAESNLSTLKGLVRKHEEAVHVAQEKLVEKSNELAKFRIGSLGKKRRKKR